MSTFNVFICFCSSQSHQESLKQKMVILNPIHTRQIIFWPWSCSTSLNLQILVKLSKWVPPKPQPCTFSPYSFIVRKLHNVWLFVGLRLYCLLNHVNPCISGLSFCHSITSWIGTEFHSHFDGMNYVNSQREKTFASILPSLLALVTIL